MADLNIKAHDFKQVFDDLGYDLSKLGCIMLDIVPKTNDGVSLVELVKEVVPESDLYYSENPARFWIKGAVCEKPHVTLLYGLIRSGLEMKKHVDTVLDGKLPELVEVDHVGAFPSPYDDDQYYCIVAHLKVSDELIEANERLKFLPHINTFPGYKAHVTLAYIRKDDRLKQDVINRINARLAHQHLSTGELDYGGNK